MSLAFIAAVKCPCFSDYASPAFPTPAAKINKDCKKDTTWMIMWYHLAVGVGIATVHGNGPGH